MTKICSEYSFSRATLADIDDLCALENIFKSDHMARRQMVYHLDNPRTVFLVCREKETKKPVGYALFYTRAGRAARFYSLIVNPTHRGRGIARTLIRRGLATIKRMGARAALLEVDAKDKKTIRLYEEFGFKLIKKLPRYYEDGRDGLKMRKDGL